MIVDGKKIPHNFEPFDTNNDGLIDRIEWVVPSLSEEIYEISSSSEEIQDQNITERDFNSDTRDNGDGTFTKTYYPGIVNIPLDNGTYVPFREVVDVSIANGEIM